MAEFESVRSREIFENPEHLLSPAKAFQAQVRDAVLGQLLTKSAEDLSQVVAEGSGDVSYKIDAHAEDLIGEFATTLSKDIPLCLTAEGFGRKNFGKGTPEIEIIIDPIDGTRGIMYNFRPAYSLMGIAPAFKDRPANLSDIQIAIQTELPICKPGIKPSASSVLWAIKEGGAFEEIVDPSNGLVLLKRQLQASQAKDLRNGFATFVDFFPGSKGEIGALADRVFEKLLGPVQEGKAGVFDDQYICNAGQMYLLTTGAYRFIADLRPEMEKVLNKQGKKLGLASHPYDLSTALIATEAGAIITDAKGNPLTYPFDTQTNCSWVGYANKDLQTQIQPVLTEELENLLATK